MAVISAFSPVDGQKLADFAETTSESIAQQMMLARQAGAEWAKVPVARRAKILGRLMPLLLAELDNICAVIAQTTGKVYTEALLGELYPLLDLTRYYQNHAAGILKDRGVVTSRFAFPGSTAAISRRPFGVVAVISPWNYPFQLTVGPLLSALFAGNAVIFKPSELSLPVGELIMQLFARLPLPANLVQWVIGGRSAGEALIDAAPDLVFFTGGPNSGRAVMQRAARHPVPVLLELGGKDPMLVFADAHLQRACDGALYGAFCNSGQACAAIERLYVEQAVFEPFLQLLRQGVAQLAVGFPHADIGAMTTEAQFAIVKSHYDDALAQGAKASGPLQREGNLVKPVLLWQVHHGMRIMREETFGPLLPVMAFANEAEAVKLANDCEFGLNASIWSRDIEKARRVAGLLETGNWAVNDTLKNIGHAGLPFGGVKRSGFGRYHGAEGLLSFTYAVSGLTCRSRLAKEPNWFPYTEQRYADFKGYLDFVYGTGSLFQRIRRNWRALEAFKAYSAFNFRQRWRNFILSGFWKQD